MITFRNGFHMRRAKRTHPLTQVVLPLCLCGLILLFSVSVVAQPSPRSVLGFAPADDKTVADWTQVVDYFSKLDKGSEKVAIREIGKPTLGQPLIVAFISSTSTI